MLSDILSAQLATDIPSIVRIYKQAQVTHPDDIRLKYVTLITPPNTAKNMAIVYIVVSVPLLLFLIGFLTLPLSIWYLQKMKKRVNLIKSGTEAYCKEIGVAFPN